MKFIRKITEDIESYKSLSSTKVQEQLKSMIGKDIFVTSSPIDVVNYLRTTDHMIRILYDSNIDQYFLSDADEFIHFDMVTQAAKEGYYYDLEDFIISIGDTMDNYTEYGQDGGWIENEDGEEVWIEPYLYYIIFDPTNTWKVGDDDYDEEYRTSIGTFFTRDCNLNEIDLYDKVKNLQIKEKIKDSKNTIYNSASTIYNSDIKQKERGKDSMKKKDTKSKKTEIKTKDNLMEETKEDTEMSKEELMDLILTTLPLVKFEDLSEEELNNWE